MKLPTVLIVTLAFAVLISVVNGSGSIEERRAASTTQDHGAADAPSTEDERKLFVGGLSLETSEQGLQQYFGAFGEIEWVTVKTDPNTGLSRGYAFVVFSNTEALDKVLEKAEHTIDGKTVDPKRTKARLVKIFVSGLRPEMSDDDIKSHFSTIGKVVDFEIPMDTTTNTRKGFCFITFEDEARVHELIRDGTTKIKDIEVTVKKAVLAATTEEPTEAEGGGYRGYEGYGHYNGAYL